MILAGCQIKPIDVNFHLQKSLENFDKNSADKIWSKKDKEIKVSPIMPFRVKYLFMMIFQKSASTHKNKVLNHKYELEPEKV